MNNVILLGRFTKEPELKKTYDGKSFIPFTLAVNKKNNRDEADFINCVAWEKTAELISMYFKKGHRIIVEGRLQSRTYERDVNGTLIKQNVHDVVVYNIGFIEPKEEYVEEEDAPPDDKPVLDIRREDLPF